MVLHIIYDGFPRKRDESHYDIGFKVFEDEPKGRNLDQLYKDFM